MLVEILTAAATAAAETSVQIDGPVQVDNVPDGFDIVIGIAQIIAAVVALVGIPLLIRSVGHTRDQVTYAKEQISHARADAQFQRALMYQDHYTSREFRAIASRMLAYVDADDAADAVVKLRAWELAGHAEAACLPRSPRDPRAPQPCKNDVLQVLGFFEVLGTSFNSKQIDRDVLERSFGTIPTQILCTAWWHLCWLRDGRMRDETQLYVQFQDLVTALRRDREDLQEMTPNAKIRLLALPPAGAQASTWRLAAQLSSALSARLAAGDSCARVLTDVRCAKLGIRVDAAARAGLISQVILVPPTIDVTARDWAAQRRAADQLVEPLGALDASELQRLVAKLADRDRLPDATR